MSALDAMLTGPLSITFTADEWAAWMRQCGWGAGVIAHPAPYYECDREAEILERQIWSGGAWQPGDRM